MRKVGKNLGDDVCHLFDGDGGVESIRDGDAPHKIFSHVGLEVQFCPVVAEKFVDVESRPLS